MKKLVALLLVALVSLPLLAACDEGDTFVNAPGAAANGISVTATGSAYGAPDVVRVQLGVSAEAANVSTARENAATAAQAVIDSVKRNGVDAKDIQTVRFDVSPVYDTVRTGTPVIRAYRVSNVLSVTIRKIETAGKVIDDAVSAGGNSAIVQGISFAIDDPEELREKAREEAVKAARAKAEQLAREAGVGLGKALSISEGQEVVPFPQAALAAPRTGADTATPIESGELQITISVSVLYAIE